MASDPTNEPFTRTDPWASIGLLRRVARICRIIFGCTLSSALLLAAALAVHELFSASSIIRVFADIAIILFVTPLAWAVGCMFIWRGVHHPPEPSSGENPPPPPEGAPRPAPLRPFSPLIQVAAAELPHERSD